MKNLFLSPTLSSALLGLFFLVVFFLLCLCVVVGLKLFLFFLQDKFFYKPEPEKPKRKRKPIRSIEINPDDVDRIVVKKN